MPLSPFFTLAIFVTLPSASFFNFRITHRRVCEDVSGVGKNKVCMLEEHDEVDLEMLVVLMAVNSRQTKK